MSSEKYQDTPGTFRKTAEQRTELEPSVSGRSTPIEEEWEALNIFYEAFPENFPEPYRFDEHERAIYMKQLDLDTKLEYATLEGYTAEEAESLYWEVEAMVAEAHQDDKLVPHADLIGNVWIESGGGPVVFDPRGIPRDVREEQRWIEEDRWQLEWIADAIGVSQKLI
jgi:hypothetical protein